MANDLVVKDNRLINAKFNFSKTQIKFIAFMASRIDKDDMDFFTYEMPLHNMLDILSIERTNIKYLDNTLTDLMTKIVVIQDNDEYLEKSVIVSYFKIDKRKNTVEYRFDKAMKPFLLQLQKNFTKLSLEKILNFDSSYTIRLYEIVEQRAALLKKYKNEKLVSFEMDLQELKEILVGEYNTKKGKIEIKKSYERYNNFKMKILDVAYEELKSKGDYYFEYEPIKTGRSVTSIKFTIMTNKEKIKDDFKDKKKKNLLSGKEKQVAQEQIRRIIERTKNIKDPLKFEQALYKKFLKGELNYDKDLKEIVSELDRKELESTLKQYAGLKQQEEQEAKIAAYQERARKFKENLEKEKANL